MPENMIKQPSIGVRSVIELKPLLVSVNEAVRLIGIGRTALYEYINSNELDTVRIGGRRLIKLSSIDDFIDRMSEMK
jgi:excisionase family DNA binding protein